MSRAHHSKRDRRMLLVQADEESAVPVEVGVVTSREAKLLWLGFIILWGAAVALLIWVLVLFLQNQEFYTSNAITDTNVAPGYMIYRTRSAEPYNGAPAYILPATDPSTCVSKCTSDSKCPFFTYDYAAAQCYMYNRTTIPGQAQQYAGLVVPGPTSIRTDVYVKQGSIAAQLRGALH